MLILTLAESPTGQFFRDNLLLLIYDEEVNAERNLLAVEVTTKIDVFPAVKHVISADLCIIINLLLRNYKLSIFFSFFFFFFLENNFLNNRDY